MFSKKVTLIFLITVLIIVTLSTTSFADNNNFNNKGSSWSKEALNNAVKNNLIKGIPDGLNPKEDLLRSEMACIMNNIFNSHNQDDISNFTDVSIDDWYFEDMAKAVHMGMFTGFKDKLNPNDKITRQEAFAVISRAFKVKELYSNEEPKKFDDLNKISAWAKEDIYALINAKYINGSNGKVNPTGNITVEEFLQLMDNIIGQLINEPGIYKKVDKGNIIVNKPAVIIRNQTIGGDLIIAEGVAEEDVILENVVVMGNIIVRGGELSLKEDTLVENILIDRVDGDFNLQVDENAIVKRMTINSKSTVNGKGKVWKILVTGGNDSNINVEKTYVDIINKSVKVLDKEGYRVKIGNVLVNE